MPLRYIISYLSAGTFVFLCPELGAIHGKETTNPICRHNTWPTSQEHSSGCATPGHCRNRCRYWNSGVTTSLTLYMFSSQSGNSFQEMTETILTIWKQINSLAVVVPQNPWGLNVFTAKEDDRCLSLQEEYFCINESGIARNYIHQLQQDIQKFREQLEATDSWIFENPICK